MEQALNLPRLNLNAPSLSLMGWDLAIEPMTERYPWLCVPSKCQNPFTAVKFPGFWTESLGELTFTVMSSPAGSLLLTCVCFTNV